MTKADIVSKISSNLGVERDITQKIVEAFMDTVKDSMLEGDSVFLRGFGTFHIKTRAEKTGRNITKNTSVVIPAHNIPAFKPSKLFAKEIKENLKINS